MSQPNTTPPSEIVVVGSINLDVSIPVPNLPLPGETVLGGDAMWSAGGKGANQAVAAARLGRRVAMVAAVGDDSAGADMLAGLRHDQIDTSGVEILAGVSTGVATIAVDAKAENSIVVSPGANGRLSAERIRTLIRAGHPLADASFVMAQFEVPIDALVAVAELAPGRLVLNPAPAVAPGTPGLGDLVGAASVLIPNRGELAMLLDQTEAATNDELIDQARQLAGTDAQAPAVLMTLGGAGALLVEGRSVTEIPIVAVQTVDTTAAGDSFCGAVVDALVDGASLAQAAQWAAKCAAVTVTRRGAQDSLPTRSEVLAG